MTDIVYNIDNRQNRKENLSMDNVTVVPLKDQAADALRREIYRGTLTDGMELRQEDIAAQLGISRIPVREAMQQLQNEGLLIRLPNRHIKVVGARASRIRQSFAVLAAMECEIYTLAEPTLREKGLPELTTDWDFHLAIAESLDNPAVSQRFEIQRRMLLKALATLVDFTDEDLKPNNQAIVDAFNEGREVVPYIRKYYNDLADKAAKELDR